jgi:hypothetical protein
VQGEDELELGRPAPPRPVEASNRGVVVAVAAAATVALVIGALSLLMIGQARQEAAAARQDANAALEALEREREEAASAAAAEAEAEAAAEEAAAAAAEQAAADRAAAEEEAELAAGDERQRRQEAVGTIEESIAELADEHVEEGLIDGPVVEVTCSPVAGGFLDDLTEVTTTFECFVARELLDDGRARGRYYNATMNWDTGSYTYGLGSP